MLLLVVIVAFFFLGGGGRAGVLIVIVIYVVGVANSFHTPFAVVVLRARNIVASFIGLIASIRNTFS